MNYGTIIIVMFLDLNMWQTQMFYDPFKYAQYTGPDHKVGALDSTRSYSILYLNYKSI